MRRELDNFIIQSDIELDYFNEVVDHISKNEKRILDFFRLEKLSIKINIMILTYGVFKEFIVSKYGEILNYVSGDSDSPTKTIRILNVDDQKKYTIHKDASVESIKGTALHEIVHQCHHTIQKCERETIWFSEALALNLSDQKNNEMDLNNCDFNELKKNFNHYKNSYPFAYTIGKYLFENYSDDELFKLSSDAEYLKMKTDLIFEEAKEWMNKKYRLNSNKKNR